jgi:hypothetical protein
MTSVKDIIDESQHLSTQISSQVRQISIGLLAVMWAIFIGRETIIPPTSAVSATELAIYLLIICGLSVLTLFLDFLQYVAGYFYVDRKIKDLLRKGEKEGDYDIDAFYMARCFCYWAKQVILLINVCFFLWLMFTLIISLART